MAPGEGETVTADQVVRDGSERLVSATVWEGGEDPREFDPSGPPPSTGIRWFDVGPSATPEGLLELLGSACPGLEPEMLDDLLAPDEIPENRRWQGGRIRLASSFAVYAPEARDGGGLKPIFTPSAEAFYEAVELLASDDWLITRWHDACLYRGAENVGDGLPPATRDDVRRAVSKRWTEGRDGGAGDLGVLVLHELALTYAPTHRRFHAALEEWELRLYDAGGEVREPSEEDERRLHDLWGARARLRDWLNPLNIPGLRSDPDKAWLPARDHKEVVEVDKRIDKSLAALSKLGETLRSSLHLLHIQKSEAQQEHNEELQWRLQLLAAIFIVPTLIVGFYGANTWVPGEHRHWGFLVMVAAMVVLTCIGLTLLWVANHHRRSKRLARQERRALR
jgi:CorA-like Mg2+ transporter protein